MDYRNAPEVAQLGQEILDEHHPRLHGVHVEWVFVEKAPKSKGKELWARSKKVAGLNAFLAAEKVAQEHYGVAEDFFVVEVSELWWTALDEDRRRALLDRELCSMEIEEDDAGNVQLAIVGPGLQEFPEIIARHGLWTETLEDFGQDAAEQLSLMDDEERSKIAARRAVEDMDPECTSFRQDIESGRVQLDVVSGEAR